MPRKLALLFIVLLLISCSKNSSNKSDDKIKAVVSIAPMKFIVEQIGGSNVEVSSIIPIGSDPHTFDPSPQTIKKIHDSDVYFLIGGSFIFEKNTIADVQGNDTIKFVDCSKGISLKNDDPHIWLGMKESKILAKNIANKLIKLDDKNKDIYKRNLLTFNYKVDSLESKIKSKLTDSKNRIILVYHPAWRYFLDQFNIKEESIEKEGKHPKAGDLKQIIEESKLQNIKAIFLEEQFNPEAAESIADELNLKVIKVNPLTNNLFDEWSFFSNKIVEFAN